MTATGGTCGSSVVTGELAIEVVIEFSLTVTAGARSPKLFVYKTPATDPTATAGGRPPDELPRRWKGLLP